MYAKFAFISHTDCQNDYIFSLWVTEEDEVNQIVDDLNNSIKDAHVEFISLHKNRPTNYFGQYQRYERS